MRATTSGKGGAAARRDGLKAERLFAEAYDRLPRTAGRPDQRFYRRCAREAAGPVLELGCGTGRLLLPLAKASHRVTGLDLSQPMLRICQAKVRRLPRAVRERIQIVHGDMTRFALSQRFGAVLIPFSGLQLLPRRGQAEACLRCAWRHLAPGGKLAFDVFRLPAYYFQHPPQREEPFLRRTLLRGGRTVRVTIRGDKLRSSGRLTESKFVLYVTDRRGRERSFAMPLTLRHFSRREFEAMLRRCGFRLRRVSGDFRGGKLRPWGRMVFEAVKNGDHDAV